MNFSTAIRAALKILRANGQSITDATDIFIHAIDGKLIVAAPNGRFRETIAVVLPFPFKTDRVICGTFSANLRKLFTALQNHAHQVTTALDNKGFHLVIKGVSFRYRINLKESSIKITRAIDLTENSKTHVETLDCNAVHCVILDEQLTSTENNMPLTITNNYFEDLAVAVDANLFVRNGKSPKKADLYLAIDAHNAQLVKAPEVTIEVEAVEVPIEVEAVEVQAVPPTVEAPEVTIEVEAVEVQAVLAIQSTEAYDILRSQWKADKVAKIVAKEKTAPKPKEYLFAAKDNKSNPGKNIVALIELLKIGATKEAICQTFNWKSWNAKTTVVLNYGYTLQLEDGIYSIAQ